MMASAGLLSLARGVCAQVRSYGILAGGGDRKDLRDKALLPRLRIWQMFFHLLDATGLARKAMDGQPMIYNTAHWPADADPAGYFNPHSALGLEPMLMTQFLMWDLQTESDTGATLQKLLRAALWVVRERGVLEALRYLFEVQKSGFLFDFEANAAAITILLDVRRKVNSDHDIVDAMVLTPKADATAWQRVALLEIDLDAMPVLREHLSDDLEYLLDMAEAEVEAMVLAHDLDEWTLGQFIVHKLLCILYRVFRSYDVWENLAFIGRTTRLEEIVADAGAFEAMLRIYGSYGAHFTHLGGMARFFKDKFENWKECLIEERALIPADLQHLMLRGDDIAELSRDELPLSWRQLSPAVVPMFAACVFDDDQYWVYRPLRFRAEEVLQNNLASAFFEAEGIADPQLRMAFVNLVSEPTGRLLSEEDVEHVLREAGIDDEVRSRLEGRLRGAVLTADVERRLAPAMQSTAVEREASAVDWESFNRDYPYFDYAMLERAIALDQAGDPQSALPLLVDAVLLRPDDFIRWTSLSVVLERLGDSLEANVAKVVAMQLESAGAPYS
jgi:hypothetical protein